MFSNESEITEETIHSLNVADLKKLYGLNYILPKQAAGGEPSLRMRSDAAVFVHLFYEDLAETCFPFIREATKICDVYITTSQSKIKYYIETQCVNLAIENCHIKLVENRGYDIASLLVHHKNDILCYKYFCFTHDKKSPMLHDEEKSRSWFLSLWENTVPSAGFISNVLQCFDEHALLGFLAVPLPVSINLCFDETKYWVGSCQDVIQLAKSLDLNCRISPDKLCISVGTAFWARTKSVRLLFEKGISLDSFPKNGVWETSYAIERIFPYIAQHNGYYTGTVASDEYESYRDNLLYSKYIEYIEFYSYAKNIINPNVYVDFDTWNRFVTLYKSIKDRYSKFYIYGAGRISKMFITTAIAQREQSCDLFFDAVVVSDGHRTASSFMGFRVFELSEVQDIPTSFFYIALSEKNANAVSNLLNEKKGHYIKLF